jgi:hypothetical protein
MNSYDAEYKKKLITPEKAVELIGSGDLVVIGMNNAEPPALLAALAAGRGLRSEEIAACHAPTARMANTILPRLYDCIQVYSWSAEHLKGAHKIGMNYFNPTVSIKSPTLPGTCDR